MTTNEKILLALFFVNTIGVVIFHSMGDIGNQLLLTGSMLVVRIGFVGINK